MKPTSEATSTQLEILQTRLCLHGARLWQLPFSYLGIVAVSIGLAEEEMMVSASQLLFALGVVGIAVALCMFGAHEGYRRAAIYLENAERALGLVASTRYRVSHTLPYFLIVTMTTGAAFYLAATL